MSSSGSSSTPEYRRRDERKSSSASTTSTSSSSSTASDASTSDSSARHHTNWICCSCNQWTNHPTLTCRRLLSGYTLIDYNWDACTHEKCEKCVRLTDARWKERFPY